MDRRLWRGLGLLVVFGVLFVIGAVMAGGASATGGPHEASFGTTTDACAGCHRAHTATAPKLLKSADQYSMCVSCHDGSGSDVNVIDGVYSGTTEGTQNAGLRGGGFTNANMDPDVNGTVASAAVTSEHNVGAVGTMWGNGAIGSGAGQASVQLQCGSCHNPHGNSSYRILRPTPNDSGAGTGVTVTDDVTKNYTIAYDGNNRRDMTDYVAGTLSALGDWCAQCHTRYLATAGSGSTDSGDAIFGYRHHTDALATGECMVCHVSHGTSATMGSNSGAVTLPDGTAGGGASDSRLLHINSRGVCMRCHTSADLTTN